MLGTVFAANNLGLLYADKGKLEEAEHMYERALAGCEKRLGREHRRTLNASNLLASVRQ